jgi:phage FluMu protein gp41
MKYELKRPVVFEDETYTELEVDFEKLVGEDLKAAERAFNREEAELGGPSPIVKQINTGYLAHVVAIAASVSVELINKLPAKDFSTLTLDAQTFLIQ